MEPKQSNYEFKVIFYILDYTNGNKNKSLKLNTLQGSKIEINDKKIIIPIILDKKNIRKGEYKELVSIYDNSEIILKTFVITLSCCIDNIFTLFLNEENGIGIQIEAMWEMGDKEEAKNEREIKDIEYNGEKLEFFERLYERKRWNLLNINIELIQKDLFSEETLNYIKSNRNLSYKYDIFINKEGAKTFLKENINDKKVKFLTDDEKKELKNKLEKFNKEIDSEIQKINLEYQNNRKKFISYIKFLNDNMNRFKEFENEIKIYNNRWDLNNFNKDDFILFERFSRIILYFTPKVFGSLGYLKIIIPEYNEFLKRLKSIKYLNFIESSRIICGFAKFCSKILNSDIAPKLIIFEELNKENPYRIAIEKYKNIIESLDESSTFFKKILIYDSGANNIINDWDFKDFNVKRMINSGSSNIDNFYFKISNFQDLKFDFEKGMKKKIAFPSLSMLSLNQIKDHLLDLLPKFLFIVDNLSRFVSRADHAFYVSFFNEGILFKEIIENEKYIENNHKKYVLPIMLEISHIFFSHIKTRYGNLYNSPILHSISGKNNFLCVNNFENESRNTLEYFICDDNKELKHLKTPNEKLFELCETKYWIDTDFTEMRKFNKKVMEENISEKKDDRLYTEEDLDMNLFDNKHNGFYRMIKCVF